MASALRMAVLMLVVMTILTGLAYPLAITGIAQALYPERANGSLIRSDGLVIGSKLIGQYFSRPEYFHPRPSAATAPVQALGDPGIPAGPRMSYNPLYSGGSNLAPSSEILTRRVTEAVQANRADNPDVSVPSDLVTASASGLDPDISPAAAEFQVPRVAKARGMTEGQVREIVAKYTKGRTLGLLGEPRVNILRLNLALDRASQK